LPDSLKPALGLKTCVLEPQSGSSLCLLKLQLGKHFPLPCSEEKLHYIKRKQNHKNKRMLQTIAAISSSQTKMKKQKNLLAGKSTEHFDLPNVNM
jgi:hypothetical protein